MITQNHRQEILSRAYVNVIAARCGFTCASANLDYGIDVTVLDVVKIADSYCESGFKIDIQLKSSIGAIFTPAHIRYDLEVAAYNTLVPADLATPRLLVLLVLPDNEAEWTAQSETCLEIRRCAYWFSAGMPISKNKRAVRISIPRVNVFSIEQLTQLMERVRRREKL